MVKNGSDSEGLVTICSIKTQFIYVQSTQEAVVILKPWCGQAELTAFS